MESEDLFDENSCDKLVVSALESIGILPVDFQLLHDEVEFTGRIEGSLNAADFLMTHFRVEAVVLKEHDYLFQSCSYDALCTFPVRFLKFL